MIAAVPAASSRGASPHTRPRRDQQQSPLGSPLPPHTVSKAPRPNGANNYRFRRSSLIRLSLLRHPCLSHVICANGFRRHRGGIGAILLALSSWKRERQDSQIFSVVTYQRLTPATSFLAAQKVFWMSCMFVCMKHANYSSQRAYFQKYVVIYQRLPLQRASLQLRKCFGCPVCLFV